MVEMSKYRHLEFKVYDEVLMDRLLTMPVHKALGIMGVQYYIFTMSKEGVNGRDYIHGYLQSTRSYTRSSWLKKMRDGGEATMLRGYDDHNLLISSIRMASLYGGDVWEGGVYLRVGRYTPTNTFNDILLSWMEKKYIEIYGEIMSRNV